jgi:predicted PurR-regulated permease PerM
MTDNPTFRAVFWAGMALLVVVAGSAALYVMRDLLTPVLAGLLVAYLLFPGLVKLGRVGVNRWLSVTLLILVVLAVGGLALYWTAPLLNQELKVITNPAASPAVLATSRILSKLSTSSEQLAQYGFIPEPWSHEAVRAGIGTWITSERGWLFGEVGGFVWDGLEFLMMFVFALVFGLIDGHRFYRGLLGLLPNAFFEAGVLIINETAKLFGYYLRGVVVETIVLGAVSMVLLLPLCLVSKLTITLAVVMALLIALTNPIRVIGPIIGTAVGMILVLVFTADLKAVAGVLLVAFVAQALDDVVILPLVMSEEVDIHPLTALIAVAAGGIFAGAVGMILAIPVVGGVKVAYRTITVEMKRFQTLSGSRHGLNGSATGRREPAPDGA